MEWTTACEKNSQIITASKRKHGSCNNLHAQWSRLYRILKILSQVTYSISIWKSRCSSYDRWQTWLNRPKVRWWKVFTKCTFFKWFLSWETVSLFILIHVCRHITSSMAWPNSHLLSFSSCPSSEHFLLRPHEKLLLDRAIKKRFPAIQRVSEDLSQPWI